jgi:putative FmdB family regulatory protein
VPIYEYQCKTCGKVQELIILTGDDEPEKCECGGELKKIVSHSSFHLKGTGWYATDYQNKKPPQKKSENKNIS